MTNEEYDQLSEDFAKVNAELIRAKESGDADWHDRARSAFNESKMQLDAAYAELNGHTMIEGL